LRLELDALLRDRGRVSPKNQMFAVYGDAFQGQVHGAAEKVIRTKQTFGMEALLDRPFEEVSMARLERLQPGNEVVVVTILANNQANGRASTKQRA
jgi:hypothetical protein